MSSLKIKSKAAKKVHTYVKVEDLDRAVLAIIGPDIFMKDLHDRPKRHQIALDMIEAGKLTGTDVETVLTAKAELDRYGSYEQPLPGMELRSARAHFEFEEFDPISGIYAFKCVKPSKMWKLGTLVGVDTHGIFGGVIHRA
jgi:hypothetical protein